MRCDVADPDSVAEAAEAAMAHLGDVSFVMHAAGVVLSGDTSLGTPLQHQRWVFDVNVMGTIHVLATFVPRLVAQSLTSTIVVTGSENSLGTPHIRAAAYTASKQAVLGYADVVRRELPEHVRLKVLCPGIVATDLWRSSERRQGAYGGAAPAQVGAGAGMALGMPPEDVAAAVMRGLELDDFLIMSHDHVRELARERYELIIGAVDRQVPDLGGRYALSRIAELRRAATAQAEARGSSGS